MLLILMVAIFKANAEPRTFLIETKDDERHYSDYNDVISSKIDSTVDVGKGDLSIIKKYEEKLNELLAYCKVDSGNDYAQINDTTPRVEASGTTAGIKDGVTTTEDQTDSTTPKAQADGTTQEVQAGGTTPAAQDGGTTPDPHKNCSDWTAKLLNITKILKELVVMAFRIFQWCTPAGDYMANNDINKPTDACGTNSTSGAAKLTKQEKKILLKIVKELKSHLKTFSNFSVAVEENVEASEAESTEGNEADYSVSGKSIIKNIKAFMKKVWSKTKALFDIIVKKLQKVHWRDPDHIYESSRKSFKSSQ